MYPFISAMQQLHGNAMLAHHQLSNCLPPPPPAAPTKATAHRRRSVSDRRPAAQRPHHCECGRAYETKSAMNYHRKWICASAESFRCAHCPYKAKRFYCYQQHLQRKHRLSVLPASAATAGGRRKPAPLQPIVVPGASA